MDIFDKVKDFPNVTLKELDPKYDEISEEAQTKMDR